MANQAKRLRASSRQLTGMFVVLAGALAILWPAGPAAASSMTYNGVTIAPAIANLALQTGQAQAQLMIMLTNNTKTPVALTASSVDFKSLNSTGGVAFIGNNAAQVAHKYGLASWLDVPAGLIELAPKQSKRLSVMVENRRDLSPGGHYAAVLFRTVSPSSTNAANRVTVNQVVSTLVFVRKVDGERYGISLPKPSVPASWLQLPANVDLFFRNTGNVQEVPRGLVTVSAPFSREVARGIINTDSSLVLPEDQRLVRTSLFATARAWLPGRYTLRVSYHSDGSPALQTASVAFWYVNLPFAGGCVAVFGVLWLVVAKLRTAYRHRLARRQRHRNRSF